MVIEDEIVRFKMQLLRKMPFYGDIVMRLPIVRNDAVSTAQTNGRMIEYNAKFLSGMREGQRNFVMRFSMYFFSIATDVTRDGRAFGIQPQI